MAANRLQPELASRGLKTNSATRCAKARARVRARQLSFLRSAWPCRAAGAATTCRRPTGLLAPSGRVGDRRRGDKRQCAVVSSGEALQRRRRGRSDRRRADRARRGAVRSGRTAGAWRLRQAQRRTDGEPVGLHVEEYERAMVATRCVLRGITSRWRRRLASQPIGGSCVGPRASRRAARSRPLRRARRSSSGVGPAQLYSPATPRSQGPYDGRPLGPISLTIEPPMQTFLDATPLAREKK